MKRCARIVPFALVLGAAVLGGACRRGAEDGVIVASGNVEATEVLVSTKVARRRRCRCPWTRARS